MSHYRVRINHERWLVSYADFITLLFGFFVVMYSVSQVSEQKYKVLSDTLNRVFDGKVAVTPAEKSTLEALDGKRFESLSAVDSLVGTQDLAQAMSDALVHLVQAGDINVNANEAWLQVDLNANILFDSAEANLKPKAVDVFKKVAEVLAPFKNAIEVSGHTDDVPIQTDRYRNNWELSAARAASVVDLLQTDGIAPERLSAVGYGEHQPVAGNGTEQERAQNRRVVLLIARAEADPGFIRPSELGSPAGPEPAYEHMSETPEEASNSDLEPIRLENGNLLFSSDPDLPREN